MFVVEAVCVLAVFLCIEGVVAGGNAAFVDLVAARRCLDLCIESVMLLLALPSSAKLPRLTYPEVNLQVSTAAKLPVADLEGNRHLVVLVQGLVEAFALVGLHLDVMRRRK